MSTRTQSIAALALAVSLLMTACSEGGTEAGRNAPECSASAPASFTLANGCTYWVTHEGATVATGECNTGGSASEEGGAASLDLYGRAVLDGGILQSFSLNMRIEDTSWNALTGFRLGSINEEPRKNFNVGVTFRRQKLPTTNNRAAERAKVGMDADRVALACLVTTYQGAVNGGAHAEAFAFKISSTEEICRYVEKSFFLVHGTIDASCQGDVGQVPGSRYESIAIHVDF